MRPMPRFTRLAAAAALLAGVAACGGGSSDAPVAPAQAPRIAITAANAPAVAAQAVDAGSAGFVGNALGVTGVQVDTASARPASVLRALGTALQQVRLARAPALLTGVTATETVQCTGGGTVVFTVDVAVRNELSPGDSATLDFSGCIESGVTMSGQLALVFTEVNAALTLIAADATATQFAARALGITERIDGTLSLRQDDTDPTRSLLRVSSSRFTFDRLVGSTLRATRSVLDYLYDQTTTVATGATSETFSYVATGSFPRLGEVSFEAATTQPVVTPGGAEHPSSGAGKVTGANGTSVAITVTATGVELAVDNDGDGDIERTITVTWAELEDQL